MRALLLSVLALAVACGEGVSPVIERDSTFLPGVSSQELALYQQGLIRFTETERAFDGLGPFYSGTSCADCHRDPVLGGSGPQRIRRAGTLLSDGTFVEPPGGSLIPSFSIHGNVASPEIPLGANVIGLRRPLPLFGAGLLEAIDDATLISLADASKPYGVKGKVAWVEEPGGTGPRVGRFGWKDAHATLSGMCDQAYRDEMGITNRLYPDELVPNGDDALLAELDTTIDPESHVGDLEAIVGFVRLLAPPPAAGTAGEEVFLQTGCGVCHVPTLTTGASSDPAFDRRTLRLYSDLLLHDVGTGDGIPQAAASGAELRTTPLWGLSRRSALLHDGSATSIEAAIERHAGEATEVVSRYHALSDRQRQSLLGFLGGL